MQTQEQAKSTEPSKPFRCKVIWIQCFHWPNITMCGKYPCACVMPEQYFVFTRCRANVSISASTRKREKFWYLCLHLCLCLCQGRFHSQIRIIVFVLVLVSLVTTRLKAYAFRSNIHLRCNWKQWPVIGRCLAWLGTWLVTFDHVEINFSFHALV